MLCITLQDYDQIRPRHPNWAAAGGAQSPGSAFTPYRPPAYPLPPHHASVPAPSSSSEGFSAPQETLVKRVLTNPSGVISPEAAIRSHVPSELGAAPESGRYLTNSLASLPTQGSASDLTSVTGAVSKNRLSAAANPFIPSWLRASRGHGRDSRLSPTLPQPHNRISSKPLAEGNPATPNKKDARPTSIQEVERRVGESWTENGAWVQQTREGKQGVWMKIKEEWLPLPKPLFAFRREYYDESGHGSYVALRKTEVVPPEGAYAKLGRAWHPIAGGEPPRTEPRVFVLSGTPRGLLAGLDVVVLPHNYAQYVWSPDKK